jgi:hypothetical protein
LGNFDEKRQNQVKNAAMPPIYLVTKRSPKKAEKQQKISYNSKNRLYSKSNR